MSPSDDDLSEILELATRAPSSHNTQPWRFVVAANQVALYADRDRALPVNDPDGRELVISCGAALLTLRVAAAHLGRATRVSVGPVRGDPDLLARVEFDDNLPPDGALADLHGAIARRQTCRGALSNDPVDPRVLEQFAQAAAAEGTSLHVLDARAQEPLAQLVEQGGKIQFGHRAWRRELASWMHRPGSVDGLRVPALALPVTRLVVSRLDVGSRAGRRDARLVRAAPVLLVLSTDVDGIPEWLHSGQALQRVLLVAAREGLSAGFLNQPCQVGGQLRSDLAGVVGVPAVPQVVLRIGVAIKPGAPTGRRPLREVAEFPAVTGAPA